MSGAIRNLQTKQTIVLLFKVLLVAFAAAAGTLGTARADKIFAHGAAGTGNPFSFKTEIVLGSNFVSASLLVPATGEVRFFRPNGTPMPLRVTGPIAPSPGCDGNLCTSFSYSVIGPTQFILESDDGISAFWTRVEEDQQDRTRAALKFILLQGATEVSVADVPPSDARERHGFFVTGPISPGQTRSTGIAISNPSGAQARYAAVALDQMGNEAATAEFFLGANQQAALFVNELFVNEMGNPELPADFNGSVQVLSDRDSSSVALLQTIEDLGGGNLAITISAIRTDDESAEPIPFLVGKAAEFGGGDQPGGGGPDLQVIASQGLAPRGQVGGGTVTLRRGNDVLRGTIAQDGSILIGPVPNGEWILNVQVPGFLPFERPIDFPATPFDIDLIPLALINPAWLEETLGPGTQPGLRGRLFKPQRQFNFIFDTSSFDRVESFSARENIQMVREAFKQWVFFELRGLQMTVVNDDGGPTSFGGRPAFSELDLGDVPDGIAANTIIISADPSLNGPLGGGTAFDEDNFEVLGSTLLFNPGFVISQTCDADEDNVCDVPRIASAFFWNAIFLRQFNGVDVDLLARPLSGLPDEKELLSSVFTQITANPLSFASTALDRNYWRVLARRPPGTLITADGEFLPKAGSQSAQQGLSSKQRQNRLKLMPFYKPKGPE